MSTKRVGLLGALEALPVEILIEIAGKYLSVSDTAQLRLLNTEFNNLLGTDALWQTLWARYFHGKELPRCEIEAAFRDCYTPRDFLFGNWIIMKRHADWLLFNLRTHHTCTFLIRNEAFYISTETSSLRWDLSLSDTIDGQEDRPVRALIDGDFEESLQTRWPNDPQLIRAFEQLPRCGSFGAVRFAVAETQVPGGTREDHLHLWHPACPVVLLLSQTANCWTGVRLRTRGADTVEAVTAPAAAAETTDVLYPSEQPTDTWTRIRMGPTSRAVTSHWIPTTE